MKFNARYSSLDGKTRHFNCRVLETPYAGSEPVDDILFVVSNSDYFASVMLIICSDFAGYQDQQ
ncbi:hypothetical protein BDD12DRAFT_846756 [Trichophaea hybrida]|nr:hypothetical protein BDD12DRAFT_846756 [Trichophaea hybrida]